MSLLEERAAATDQKLDELAARLRARLGDDAERILRKDTCIYVVGSGGRGEMSRHSDVDLFVARVDRDPSEVDALLVRQAIARALYEMDLPDPSKAGEYLKMHTAASLCERLGTPDDDAVNTFTARMLLLLESQPLLGTEAYETLLSAVIERYWQDVDEHADDYQPFVLVNDIVRYWRILLLNYVAKNFEKEKELKEPQLKAERRSRSYKLRFSRCLTCFSFLAALLATTAKGGLTEQQVVEIVRHTPIERLELVRERADGAAQQVEKLLQLYTAFLETTDRPKRELVELFRDKDYRAARSKEGREFGDAMFALLEMLARAERGRELFRHMVV